MIVSCYFCIYGFMIEINELNWTELLKDREVKKKNNHRYKQVNTITFAYVTKNMLG